MLIGNILIGLSACIHIVQAQNISKQLLDGVWKDWTPWTGCTSCSELLGYRTRSCDNRALNYSGSKYRPCRGVQKEYKVCERESCRKSDVRQEECDKQNHIPFRGRRYRWLAHTNRLDPCQVTCKSAHYGFYTSFNRFLKDGTPCDDTGTNVCIHGRCQIVGCDGVVGSGKQTDHCGVCGGDNDSCRIIAGIYTRRNLNFGYNQITRIPAGSCHVNITELARSRNYLVLKYANGTGIINGERTSMKRSGEYFAAGTMFTYGKQSDETCPGECLFAKGPLNADVDVQLLTYRRNPGIKYMFTIPKDLIDKVFKSLAPPSTSSRTRHEGQSNNDPQSAINSNTGSSINSNNEESSSSRTISYDEQPRFVSPDEDNQSPYAGNQALEGSDKIDNKYGTQDAINKFRQGYVQGSKVPVRSYNTENSGRGSDVRNQVNTIPTTGFRDSENRISNNVQRNNDYNQYVPGRNTIDTRKQQLYVPNTIDEINFRWTISGFTECSASCGGGSQDTIVVCMKRKTNVIVTDDNCDPDKKNVQTIVCNRSPCPADWETGPWSVCSATCGEGIQTRLVECQTRYSQNLSVPVSADLCSLSSKPEKSRSCEVKPCADWSTSNWTKCSVECGIGQSSRKVECKNTEDVVVSDTECKNDKPDTEKSCDMGTCAKGWFQTGWSKECSSPCGRGYHSRTVYCSAEDGSPLPENKCGRKPRTKKPCKKNRPCGGHWFEGPWSKCTATCGTALQTRDVVCLKKLEHKLFTVVKEVNCKEQKKPDTKRPCPNLPECEPEWYMTKWSQCSQSCGTGIKSRDVKCLTYTMEPSSVCPAKQKPSLRRSCNTVDCDLPQLDEDPNCKDSWTQCQLVVQARLCPYEHYKDKCCHSCTLHHLKHQKEKTEQQQQQEVGGA
ncbi:hypothetical protein ACF0H5_013500 [Mactra antiquata]